MGDKFTPWHSVGNVVFGRVHGDSGPTVSIARVAGDTEESFRIARLIAAAPELVEALRAFVRPYEDLSDAEITSVLYHGQETVDARALLARIDGAAS